MSLFIGHPVALDVCGMAWLAEVGRPEAEPLGDGATELALELDVVRAVLGAIGDAGTDHLGGTLGTDELLGLVVGVVLGLVAILHAAEVRGLALETHVVSQLVDGEPPEIIVEPIPMLIQSLVLIQSFILGPLHHLGQHIILYLHCLLHLLHQLRTVGRTQLLFALGAVHEAEDYPGTGPPLLQLGQQATQVEHMSALQLHARHLPQTLCETYYAVVLTLFAQCQVRILVYTFFCQARQTFLFIRESTAWMSTGVYLITTLRHQLGALLTPTYVGECWLHGGRPLHHLGQAESTLLRFLKLLVLLACLPQVIWLSRTLSAECFVACSTPEPVSA